MLDLLSDQGMSAPAWGFFSTLVIMVGGVLREQIRARRRTEEVAQIVPDDLTERLDDIVARLEILENGHGK